MGIQEDINQSKFRNEYQKAGINIIYTFNWMTEQMKAMFEKHGLTSQQFNILRILRGAGQPLSTLQIRQRMLDKMSDTSRIVDRLVKKELVNKVICKNDRRLVDVSISEKGSALLHKLDGFTHELDAHLNKITVEEAKTLNELLDKLRKAEM
jgi:DNA-binding MarR family transcriptional regulator